VVLVTTVATANHIGVHLALHVVVRGSAGLDREQGRRAGQVEGRCVNAERGAVVPSRVHGEGVDG
jgi:hypothetical protein